MYNALRTTAALLSGLMLSVSASSAASFTVEKTKSIETQTGVIDYQARVESTALHDTDGQHSADVVNTSYVAMTDDEPSTRPVIFLSNGGPVVPSVYLHMGLLAPYRVQVLTEPHEPSIEWELTTNPDTLLDIADLVYVDPPMTGYSQVADARNPRDFYSVDMDAQQVADFIYKWLDANQRTESPVFLFGESYGTIRAPVTARKLVEDYELNNLRGVMLFGQAVNMVEYSQRPANILSYIASLPPLAIIAQYHGKSAYSELSIDALYHKVQLFNEQTYLPALYKGSLITEAELHQVAEQLEALTGIAADYYIENRLRISKPQFRHELLRDEGMVLGMYDARYVASVGSEFAVDPSGPLGQIFIDAYADYRQNQLAIETERDYVLRADIRGLDDWSWGGNSPFSHFNYAANLDYLFAQNPQFQLYVATGHYDLSTTTGGADYLLQQQSWPVEQVMLKRYAGGHMAYTDSASAHEMANDIRAFISGKFAPAHISTR